MDVTHEPDHHRWVAHLDDRQAGVLEYIPAGHLVVMTHTEVDPVFEGRGVGGALARAALDDARAQGVLVLALCPFVKAWIARHPDYRDLDYQAPRSTAVD